MKYSDAIPASRFCTPGSKPCKFTPGCSFKNLDRSPTSACIPSGLTPDGCLSPTAGNFGPLRSPLAEPPLEEPPLAEPPAPPAAPAPPPPAPPPPAPPPAAPARPPPPPPPETPGADLSLPAPLSASSFSFFAVSKRFCAAVRDSNAAFFSSSVLAEENFFSAS